MPLRYVPSYAAMSGLDSVSRLRSKRATTGTMTTTDRSIMTASPTHPGEVDGNWL
jgi:hypothetical protein